MDSYAYEYGVYAPGANPGEGQFTAGSGSNVCTTVIHGTIANPAGISNKTTKEVSISDEFGKQLAQETYVYTGSGYERIQWTNSYYDDFGHLTKEIRSDGTQQDSAWDCCHITSSKDAIGISTIFAYDALDRMGSSSRPGPSGDITTSFTYDAAGRKLSQTVAAGGLTQATSNQYDGAGRMTRIVSADGLATQYAYADAGRTTTVTRPGGATEIIERYLDGKVKHVYGTGVVERYYEYGVNSDGSQYATVYTGGQGSALWEKTTTDSLGRVVKTEKPGFGGTIALAANIYNNKGQLIKTQTTGQADQIYVYDAVGNQIQSGLDVDASGSLELASIDRITETDTAYAQISSDWWQQNVQKVYAANNQATATTTGTQRNRLTGLGASGLTAESVSIDISGNQTVSTAAIDRTTHTETRTIDYPDSTVDAKTISVNGFMTSSLSKMGINTTYQYDALGRQTGVTDPRTGKAITRYDSHGRVENVQDSAGNGTTYEYDEVTGRKISETNALGNVTRYAYNLQGQVVRTWGDAAYPVSYEYNAFGQMTAMTTYRTESGWDGTTWPSSASGDTTTWTYDLTPSPGGEGGDEGDQGEGVTGATGLLIAKTDAAGNATTYTYDTSGRLSTRTWARSVNNAPVITTYTYNPATGDLTGINYSDATPAVTFAYDRLGRQTQITDATGNRTFTYNDNLQLAQESMTGIINRTLTRNYETSGVPSRSTGFSVNGYSVSYAYDAVGRMNQVGWNANTQTGAADYAYVPNADLLASVSVNGSLNTTYTYEPNRNNKTQVKNSYNSQVVSQYDYAYDAFGRRTSVVNTGTAFAANAHNSYGYDDRNELTESARYQGGNPADTSQPVQPEYRAYQYDPIGNRKTLTEATNAGTYTANNLNQYTQQTVPADSSRTFNYDQDGNLLSLVENGAEKVYTWNAENRLVTVAPTSPSNGDKKVEFIYDYMGRRAKKTVSIYSSGSWILASDSFFVYDGWNLIEEYKEVGATHTSRYFVWGLDLSQSLQGAGGIGGLLATVDGSATYLYCYDGNGNVGQVLNGADGTIAAAYEYDPYGKPTKANGAYAGTNPFRFSTKYDDDETGLFYFGYRYYSNELGRWISKDPIEENGGLNYYIYVQNNTINKIDYNGLWGTKIHKDATSDWSSELWYSDRASKQIGIEDDYVDKGVTSPWPLIGDQSYHFNRNIFGGKDTRLAHFEEHFEKAKESCSSNGNFFTNRDNPEEAVKQLGLALHPLQDWVAHGDFGMINPGMIWIPHNYLSPQESLGSQMDRALAVDDPNMDSTGPEGRAAGKAMRYRFIGIGGWIDWAYFEPGNKRLNLTKEKTQNALSKFMAHLKDNRGACKCYDYFLSDTGIME